MLKYFIVNWWPRHGRTFVECVLMGCISFTLHFFFNILQMFFEMRLGRGMRWRVWGEERSLLEKVGDENMKTAYLKKMAIFVLQTSIFPISYWWASLFFAVALILLNFIAHENLRFSFQNFRESTTTRKGWEEILKKGRRRRRRKRSFGKMAQFVLSYLFSIVKSRNVLRIFSFFSLYSMETLSNAEEKATPSVNI